MNTSKITFLWQFETFASVYCNGYFEGHTELFVDDNNIVKEYKLEEPVCIINNLNAGIYRLYTKGPDGASEDKYIEIQPEGFEYQVDYLNSLLFSDSLTEDLKAKIFKESDDRGLNLVETLYFVYLTLDDKKQKERILYLLLAGIRYYNANQFYNNIDYNSTVFLATDNQSMVRPILNNGFLSGIIYAYKFDGKFYQYDQQIIFNEERIDLGFLDRDYLYRLDIVIDKEIIGSYYVINPSQDSINLIWQNLYDVNEKINKLTESIRYLSLAYQSFDEDTKKAISLLLDKDIDNPVLQMPKIAVEEGDIYVVIDGGNTFNNLDSVYACITDPEGLAANQVLVKRKVDSNIIEIPMQGNSIYDGNYYGYLADEHNNMLSQICLFHVDEDIHHKYTEETLRSMQAALLNFLKEEFLEEDVDKYYHYFTDLIGNTDVSLSNYYDKVIDRFVQTNPYEELLDMIHYLNVYRYSNQVYRDIRFPVYNQEGQHRIIIPNDLSHKIIAAIKFKKGFEPKYEYKQATDNAQYIAYDDADYTVISIYDKKTREHNGLVTIWRNGTDYFTSSWNVAMQKELDF